MRVIRMNAYVGCPIAQRSAFAAQQRYSGSKLSVRVFVKRKLMRTKYKEVIFVLLFLPSLLFTSTIASHVIYGKESLYCQKIYKSATHAVRVLSRNPDNYVLMFFSRWGVLQFIRNVLY